MTYHTHFVRRNWVTLSLTLGLVLCGFASWRVGARAVGQPLRNHPSQSSEQTGKGQALADLLNADGTVKQGMAGSFDASGYRMEYMATGAPRFVQTPQGLDDRWDSQFNLTGINGEVSAIAVSDNDLYVGGKFSAAAGIVVNNIARWNGSNWVALGSGLDGPVSAFAVSGRDLYVGGGFKMAGGVPANGIAKWNGSNWVALGSGVGGSVRALVLNGTNLYVGGQFSSAGNKPAINIAKWNGSDWESLGSDRPPVSVNALAVIGADLYVGGALGLAKWDGSTWTLIGGLSGDNPEFIPTILTLAVIGNDLYVGGFIVLGRDPSGITSVLKWNGTNWSGLGSGLPPGNYVSRLAVNGRDLYVSGSFTTAGGSPANRIARWDGSSWAPLGSGLNGPATALAVSGNNVYAGVDFTTSATHIAKWDGLNWTAFGNSPGNGVAGNVGCLLFNGNDLYVGGGFTSVGGIPANRIAKWNGSSWMTLGSGLNGYVYALAMIGNDLYVGGSFNTAGGNPARNIAKWDGSKWTSLGAGSSDAVNALAVSGNELYASGDFQTPDGSPIRSIAKWNGSSWSALGSGMNGRVYALAVSGSDLYAGGIFTEADNVSANYIAHWNGTRWMPLGSGENNGVNYWVFSLAVRGTSLFVGGAFTSAGGLPANRVAWWNGSNWVALGSGLDGLRGIDREVSVSALIVNGNDLYVGGYFTKAGGNSARNIAKWNGSSWTPLGSGIKGLADADWVNALTLSKNSLYVGGGFDMAGNKPSANFARYAPLNVPPTITPAIGLTRPAGAAASPSQIATVTDPDGAASALTVTVNGGVSATINGITVNNLSVDTTGKVTANIATSGNATEATFTLRVTDTGGLVAEALLNITTTSPTGPGTLFSNTAPLNAQRPGSILIYNVFTSSAAAPNQQNTRLSLTNTHPVNKSYVHLFFVDGASCSVADGFVCLTPNQTTSFLASDLDPGTSGYVIAVAVDALGCPISFNHLIGDEFVKFSSGHAANLGAEAVTAIAGGLPLCDGNSPTAELRFDGLSYSVLPHVLAADNLGSRADGNDTLLILNRIGGSMATSAATLGSVFGILYDDAEAPISFSFAQGTCQWRSVISGNSIRTVPRYEQFIPAGRTGWLKVSATNLGAMTGAVLNTNLNATAQSGAFNQGHNLHKLTTTNTAALTIPVFPPGC